MVRETRLHAGVFTRRVRTCLNGHKFATYEVLIGNLDKRTVVSAQRGLVERWRAFNLRQRVLALKGTGVTAVAVGLQLGVTAQRVGQLWRAAR
jgi:hypothetical protein